MLYFPTDNPSGGGETLPYIPLGTALMGTELYVALEELDLCTNDNRRRRAGLCSCCGNVREIPNKINTKNTKV